MEAPKPAIPKRRKFTPTFKVRIVKLCEQPDAVVCKIARDYDLALNMVKRWQHEHRQLTSPSAFVPVQVPRAEVSIVKYRLARYALNAPTASSGCRSIGQRQPLPHHFDQRATMNLSDQKSWSVQSGGHPMSPALTFGTCGKFFIICFKRHCHEELGQTFCIRCARIHKTP